MTGHPWRVARLADRYWEREFHRVDRVMDRFRRARNWGATEGERAARLLGDELVAEPADTVTRAVTVEAPSDVVWAWLVQIGQDRGGFYSYDWLENLFGLQIHSARAIRPEWQALASGDVVRLAPPSRFGSSKGSVLPVARLEVGRAIVLREAPPDFPWDAVWSFHIVPLGPRRSRLLSRSRSARSRGLAAVVAKLLDPVALVMTRRMLLGIKSRAESSDPEPDRT